MGEMKFLEELALPHPVFQGLPQSVKKKLAVVNLRMLGNKRMRKRWGRDGFSVHLYAGPDKGFTLKKALTEIGGNGSILLEIVTECDAKWDMLSDEGCYGALLRAAFDGTLDAIVGGPGCRTRSVLRHYKKLGLPGPARTVDYPFGLPNLEDTEKTGRTMCCCFGC